MDWNTPSFHSRYKNIKRKEINILLYFPNNYQAYIVPDRINNLLLKQALVLGDLEPVTCVHISGCIEFVFDSLNSMLSLNHTADVMHQTRVELKRFFY